MIARIIFISGLFILLFSCDQKPVVTNVYRYYWGMKDGYHIWIVDGSVIRQKVYKEFLYGGNEQRYLYNPKGEIWIDNAVSCEEFEMTLAHELNERHLMAKYGWTYDRAHDSSLALEVMMRQKILETCLAHENSLSRQSITDYNNTKEIKGIPDSVQLKNIYLVPLGERNGVKIWIVDGYKVRANFYPDFGFSGNDMAYHFIPSKEIWIDGQISCEETNYSIETELKERELMVKGKSYDDAYETAISYTRDLRDKMELKIKDQPPIIVPDSTTRDAGLIDPSEK